MLIIVLRSGIRESDKFLNPIHQLADGVHEISSGNLDKKLEIHTGDEIEHLATNIQQSMLPYDFNLLDENHLVITIADVSGKGVPAAQVNLNIWTWARAVCSALMRMIRLSRKRLFWHQAI